MANPTGKIRDLLGGQLRVISIGAAPLSPDVYELLKVCFSCDIVFGVSPALKRDSGLTLEKYGMTEVGSYESLQAKLTDNKVCRNMLERVGLCGC